MSETDERITVYADYICPYCYLGHKILSRYQSSRDERLKIEWHPFDLRGGQRTPEGDIDREAENGKDATYFEEVRQNVRQLADRYDVEMSVDTAREIDSRNAQLASVHIQMDHRSDWQVFDNMIYAALWQNGRDIGDPNVLMDIASSVGLDPDFINSALSDPMVERRLEDQFEAARIRGITGVPTFVFGGNSVRGAVPQDQLRQLVEAA